MWCAPSPALFDSNWRGFSDFETALVGRRAAPATLGFTPTRFRTLSYCGVWWWPTLTRLA